MSRIDPRPAGRARGQASRTPLIPQLPNVVLRTQANERVRFHDDLLTRTTIVMINFFYTTCTGICDPTMHNLVKVVERMGDRMGRDVALVSISIDPAIDTPAVLARYAERYAKGPGWHFVTGSLRDVEQIRDELGLREKDQDGREATHTGLLAYGNPATGQWGAMPALGEPATIVQVVSRLLKLAELQRAS